MPQTLTGILGIALLGYVSLCVLLFVTQRSHIYHPQPRRNAEAQIMRLQTADAELDIAVERRDSTTAVIYFGGNAEDVSRSLPRLAGTFAEASVYAMHYRGYGQSTGYPTEENLVADGLALYDLVRQTYPDVTVVGRSLGSGVAVQVAAARPVSRLVLVTPFDCVATLGARVFPFVPVKLLLRDRYESWRVAPDITTPTTLIAAEQDEIVPMSSTRRLLDSFAPGVAELVVIKRAGHNDLDSFPEYEAVLNQDR